MKRILTWHYEGVKGKGDRIGAAFYAESDYTPIAVRIHAEQAPDYDDAGFEILKDGVSIMNNRDNISYNVYGVVISNTTTTTVVLAKGETSEENAEDFASDLIESGTWLTCKLDKDGGGRTFTIQLILESDSDEEDESE